MRIRYCVLKSLVSGPKSEQELLDHSFLFPEFRPIKNLNLDSDELLALIRTSVQELKNESKVKERNILNTSTKERRIEWFLNQSWISLRRLFKEEFNRVRLLEEIALKEKAKQDQLEREKEERERSDQMEKIRRERTIKLIDEQANAPEPKGNNDKSNGSNFDSFFKGILSLVAVGGGLYVIGKIGDSLSRAFTYPVFLIACAAGFSIYYLTRKNEK